ncbi:MAG: hypothetical protein DHS20C16_13530 [Phycisphaerae bacterium]|nr:MAG: hypothetical protein DHS20C16_13530 [Phycisphaerae bacterium]
MTAKRKTIYLSVLGVGLCVVVYDVATGDDGPAKAAASDSTARSDADASADSETVQGIAALSIQHFPREIDGPEWETVARDIFAPTEKAMRELSDPPVDSTEGEQKTGAPPAVPFSQQHTLSAILELQGSRSAVVDGVILRKGQGISECVVSKIAERSVRFECPEGLEELWLVDPLLGERLGE